MLESEKITKIIERKWEENFPVKRHNQDLVFFTIDPLKETYETIVLPIKKINQEIVNKMMDYNELNLAPIELQSISLWTKYIDKNILNIKYLPKKFHSYELYEMAVRNEPNLIYYVTNVEWFKKLILLIENDDRFNWNIPIAMQPFLSDYQFVLFLYHSGKENLIDKTRINKKVLDNLFLQMDLLKIKKNLYHVYVKVSKHVWDEKLYIKASINSPAFYKKIPNNIRKNIDFIEKLIFEDKIGILTSYMSLNSLPDTIIKKIIDRNVWDVEFLHKKSLISKLKLVETEPRIIVQLRSDVINHKLLKKSLEFFLNKNLTIEDNPLNENYIRKILYDFNDIKPEQLAQIYYKLESENLKKYVKKHEKFPSEIDMSIHLLEGTF